VGSLDNQRKKMTVEARTAGDNPLAPEKVLRVARKHALLVLICFVAVTLVGTFWTIGQKKVYRAETMLRLDPEPPRPLGQRVELVSATNMYWARREFFESEYRIMRSMKVAMAVVRTLNLHGDAGFLRAPANAMKPTTIEDAARILVLRLSVDPVKDSSLAVLRYEDTDPKRAQLILSTVVRIYLAQNLEANTTVSTTAGEWLNTQVDHLRSDLEKSEKAINEFRQKNHVLSISLEDRHNMLTAQLEQVGKEATTLGFRRSEQAARKAELLAVDSKDPLAVGATELLQSLVLNSLRTAYSEQLRNIQELSATLDENHPKVVAAKAKLDTTAKAIRTEVANIQNAASKDLRATDRQLGDLKKKEEELQKLGHDLQGFELTYNQLSRARTYNEKIYGLVLERARETELTRVMNFNNVRVVDEALEPKEPVRPNVPLNLAAAAVLGLFLGVALALTRELSDRSIRTPDEVEEMGSVCLGLLPEIEATSRARYSRRSTKTLDVKELKSRDLIVAQQPESGIAEAARAVRTNLTFMSPDKPFRTLVFTSAVPEEGKTTVAVSVATVLAQGGARVLLVDTDLRRPRLHRTFGQSNDTGVTLALSGQAPLEECIRPTDIPNLSLLTAGPIPPNPAELLHSERFRQLVQTVGEQFDRIIFDSPPLLPVTDAAILSQLVDGVVVVSRCFRTPRPALAQTLRTLKDVKANVLGVILNAVDFDRHDYKEYHYYYRRGYYYSDRERAA